MLPNDFNLPDDIDPEEELKMDNKIKRLELELKGAKFLEHNPDGIELPPEIEAQMLDQILAFEKIKHEAKEIEIYEYIGKPKVKASSILSAEEVILEKERLLNLLSQKGIYLTSMEDIDDRVMYEFITEEFFYKKTLDLPIKGLVRHFVYEEFHPNERLYAEKTIEFFIQSYFQEDADSKIAFLCRDEAIQYVRDFRSLYAQFKLNEYRHIASNIKKIKGTIRVYLEFEAFLDNSLKSHTYQGELDIEVRRRKGQWQISRIRFPKIDN